MIGTVGGISSSHQLVKFNEGHERMARISSRYNAELYANSVQQSRIMSLEYMFLGIADGFSDLI